MTIATKTITVLDPSARARVSDKEISSRPTELNGKVIGFLDNSKANVDVLMDRIEEALRRRYSFKGVLRRRKANAGGAAPKAILEELSQSCNLVINGVGDWGACTSWSVHDSIDLEKRGIPTATICSDEFATLGGAESRALGMPALPIVTIPHPLGGLKPEAVQAKADRVVDELIYVVTQPREKLAAEYRGKFG